MTQSIVVQVGQCGNQIGSRFWDLALREQHIYNPCQSGDEGGFFRFEENRGPGKDSSPYITKARAVLVDMEEGVISEIMKGPLQGIFDSRQLLTDVSGSGNNWAIGHFVYGQIHEQNLKELLRREAEMCDSLQCFCLLHSLGGGTGSGLGTSILEMLCDEFSRKQRFVVGVYPSSCDDVVTSPYNALLANSQLTEFADCVFPIENKALSDICDYIEKFIFSSSHVISARSMSYSCGAMSDVAYEKPFDCMNNIIANLMLNVTCSSRFPGSMNVDLNEIVINMVPYQRLHFIASSVTPLFSIASNASVLRCQNLCAELFSRQHNLFKGDLKRGTFLSCALLLRGHISLSDVQRNIDKLRHSLKFAPWNDDGWKTGLCNVPPLDYPYSAVLLSNNSSLWHPFSTLKTRFLKMYKKKAHLHHFLKVSGMEKDIFDLSLVNLDCLIEEYHDIAHLVPSEIEEPRLTVLV